MNYFELYVGDYLRDTSSLSLAQHGAYLLLMATYYGAEQPLPADAESLYRIARAMTDAERAAVDRVVAEFFPIDPADGLRHNARADFEIDKAQRRIEAARSNGGKGGRPPTRKGTKKPTGFRSANPVANPDPNPARNPNESSPHAIHHPTETDVSVAAAAAESATDVLELVEPPSDDAEAHLISITGARVPLPRSTLDRMAEAYPLVDVRAAVKRAGLWLDANPKRRPTPGGMLRFLTTWLGRDQQRASESNVRGYQSARVIDGGRRESLCERAARLGADGDAREARRAGALVAIGGGRA